MRLSYLYKRLVGFWLMATFLASAVVKLHMVITDLGANTVFFIPRDNLSIERSRPEATMIVIAAYQRSGSSFLGELFNQNHNAIYWFEPLDGLYSALYGTRFGFNVPADIWNYSNGSKRILPDYEVDAIAKVISDILRCNFDKLPTEILAHLFLDLFLSEQKQMEPYIKCLAANHHLPGSNLTVNLNYCKRCNRRLSKVCGRRFDLSQKAQLECTQLLLSSLFPGGDWRYASKPVNVSLSEQSRITREVTRYKKCMAQCRTQVNYCLGLLTSLCRNTSLRVIKAVRFPMTAANILLSNIPRVNIIHNIRDPRAVVVSRQLTSESFQAIYATSSTTANPGKRSKTRHDVVKEAVLLCRDVYEDIVLYDKLKQSRPDSRLTRVVYEKYATKPLETARQIYRFLRLPDVPTEVASWLSNHTRSTNKHQAQTTRNSTATSTRWTSLITDEERMRVSDVCSDLLNDPDI